MWIDKAQDEIENERLKKIDLKLVRQKDEKSSTLIDVEWNEIEKGRLKKDRREFILKKRWKKIKDDR